MAFCGDGSTWAKLTLLLLLPAMAFHCAALGTPYWMKTATVTNTVYRVIGLWKQVECSGEYSTPCVGQALNEQYKTNLMTATRVLECAVVVPGTFAILLAAFFVLSPGARTQRVAAWIMLFSFIAFAFGVAGAGTCIANAPEDHYVFWSLGLCLLGSAFYMLCGVMIIPDIRKFDYDGIKRKRLERQKKKTEKKQGKQQQRRNV